MKVGAAGVPVADRTVKELLGGEYSRLAGAVEDVRQSGGGEGARGVQGRESANPPPLVGDPIFDF